MKLLDCSLFFGAKVGVKTCNFLNLGWLDWRFGHGG